MYRVGSGLCHNITQSMKRGEFLRLKESCYPQSLTHWAWRRLPVVLMRRINTTVCARPTKCAAPSATPDTEATNTTSNSRTTTKEATRATTTSAASMTPTAAPSPYLLFRKGSRLARVRNNGFCSRSAMYARYLTVYAMSAAHVGSQNPSSLHSSARLSAGIIPSL